MNFKKNEVLDCKDEMQLIFNDMIDAFDKITNIYNNLKNDSIWEGIAKDYYVNNLKLVVNNFSDTEEAMKNIIIYLNSVINKYQNLEQTIISQATKGWL